MDFDRIISSTPVNAQSAKSMAKGVHFKAEVQLQGVISERPELADIRPYLRDPHFEDFTGLEYGRLTVLGKAANPISGGGRPWVCRCKCGNYTTRKNKAVKNRLADRCAECEYVKALREGLRK